MVFTQSRKAAKGESAIFLLKFSQTNAVS